MCEGRLGRSAALFMTYRVVVWRWCVKVGSVEVPHTAWHVQSRGVTVMCEGRLGRSAAHCLTCSLFPVLQRSHANMFVIRTVASIGEITAVRVWHYNLGAHPKWSVFCLLFSLVLPVNTGTSVSCSWELFDAVQRFNASQLRMCSTLHLCEVTGVPEKVRLNSLCITFFHYICRLCFICNVILLFYLHLKLITGRV